MIPIQVTSTVMALGIAGAILLLARRDKLHFRFTAWWLLASVGILLLGIFPWLTDILGEVLGIAYPPILIVILGMAMLLVKILTMDIDRSRHERHIRRLSQRLALLEEELRRVRQGQEEEGRR